MDSKTFRCLHDPPLSGPVNMARDESLMLSVGERRSPPTLRFYEWSGPTVSLGYFQSWIDHRTLRAPADRFPVVRRLTGGGAIIHDVELTYSLAVPTGHPLLERGATRIYGLVHDAVVIALADLGVVAAACGVSDDSSATRGPFLCFHRRHFLDVVVGSVKVAGSAQRRTREALLQHGSIILADRFGVQPATHFPVDVDRIISHLRRALPERFCSSWSMTPVPGDWSDSERVDAERLTVKYAGDEWTRLR